VGEFELLQELRKKALKDKPWTVGLVEAMAAVDVIGRQPFDTKNRIALDGSGRAEGCRDTDEEVLGKSEEGQAPGPSLDSLLTGADERTGQQFS
jgi:hypothetical protein